MAGSTGKKFQYSKTFGQEVPKMPEGYYSGDKPNPNLRAFVEAHLKESPYDPVCDDYDVKAFDKPIEATKATAIYNMHTYWSKKPHDAIRQYIQHYTKQGDLVLDPFCGSGSTALAALIDGRAAIVIDRSPAATYITKNYCTPVDVNKLMNAFEELNAKVKPELDWLYETSCDRCGGKAHIEYTIYSQTFQCPRCMTKVPLFDCIDVEIEKHDKTKNISVCPICYENNHIEEISTRSEKYGSIPVLVSYICENGCKPTRNQREYNDSDVTKKEYFQKYDLAKIKEIESKTISYWYPKNRMMNVPENQVCWGVKWRAGTSNFKTVDELFTKRNLWALSIIINNIEKLNANKDIKDFLKFGLTGIMLGISKMNQFRPDVSFPLNIMSGTYYLPQISKEEYIWKHYDNKISRLCMGLEYINNQLNNTELLISTDSACGSALKQIPPNSIDYLFTDPPYADKVQYGELNFVWESWLKLDNNWQNEEIIVNDIRKISRADWSRMMLQVMKDLYRILKPGRWLSLCYHDTSEGTWSEIQDIMAEAGFISDKSESALYIDTGGKTYNQTQADKVNKRDLVINFQKPKLGQSKLDVYITGDEDSSTFNEKVLSIIRDYLNLHPGSTKDRIYDEVVSRMVRSGQMETYNFDTLLTTVAEPSKLEGRTDKVDHWFIKGSELDIEDSAESAKEEASAAKLKVFIINWLKDHPSEEGIHYSNLFEHYIFAVKDMPRRPLAEWLPDYFYKTDNGMYRLPVSKEEEKLKAESRSKGVNRRIKRYLSYIMQSLAVPEEERLSDITLADWIRNCKRSGMYDQGKQLYEKGGINLDNLSEDAQANVEEDYQVCVRMIERQGNNSSHR